jgi:hypothetical protein
MNDDVSLSGHRRHQIQFLARHYPIHWMMGPSGIFRVELFFGSFVYLALSHLRGQH